MGKLSLNEMLDDLAPRLREQTTKVSSSVANFFADDTAYIIFLSATDEKKRAKVVQASGASFQSSWDAAVQKLKRMLLMDKVRATQVKADLVTTIETVPFQPFMRDLAKLRKNYFRQGIAFDRLFQYAFLEQEMNGNVFFNNWENGNISVALQHIVDYSRAGRGTGFPINFKQLEEVYLFDTIGIFHDGEELHHLHEVPYLNGTRKVNILDEGSISSVAKKASAYLTTQIDAQGKFRYVNFPAFNKGLDTYNILQHADTLYGMLMAYELGPTPQLLEKIEVGLIYLVDTAFITSEVDGLVCTFVLETVEGREIKLGANAFALLALTKYTAITGNDTYAAHIEPLANGLAHMQQRDGSFIHILYEDLSVKEAFCIPFYLGEAVLALATLYQAQPERKWLMAAERGLRYAIKAKHWKHGDPFINEASYLIYQVRPHVAYAQFSLQNAARQLAKAFLIEESPPLLLRLLLATQRLIDYIEAQGQTVEALAEFPIAELKRAIQFRMTLQMDSVFWPEMAMYFSLPNQINYSFYVRHDSYRIQINDVADHIVSLVYYQQFLKAENISTSVLPTLDAEAGLLLAVKQLEKQGKRTEAIQLLEISLDPEETWLAETYALYVELLRLNGQMEQTKEIIGKGNALYPKNENILVEFLNLCMSLHNYHAAQVVAKDLIKLYPEEGKYYFELGRALAEINEAEKAQAAFRVGLIHHHELSTEQLIDKIQATITEATAPLTSVYTHVGGMNNLGVIMHKGEQEDYFTKITRIDSGAQREAMFYRDLQTAHQSLQAVSPSFISLDIFDGVQYLTIKRLQSKKEPIKIEKILDAIQAYATLPYESLIKEFPNPNYPFHMWKNVGPDIVYLFTKIHEQRQNELICQLAETFAIEYGYPDEIKEMIEKIKTMIQAHKMYEQIDPKQDYSLVHADLKDSNMIDNQADDKLYILDWGSFTIGPRFSDVALLFGNSALPFEKIKEVYLDNEKFALKKAEQFYFCFIYFLVSIVKITEKNASAIYTRNLLPAMKYMEEIYRVD